MSDLRRTFRRDEPSRVETLARRRVIERNRHRPVGRAAISKAAGFREANGGLASTLVA